MFRQHWREPRFWGWWLRTRPREVLWTAAFFGLLVALGGGFLAADRLSQAKAGVSPTGSYTFETTVERLVTIRDHGRTVVKKVPVVRRVFLRPQTAYETRVETRVATRVVTTPGGVRVVERRVLHYVPVVKKHVVTVNGRTKTVTETKLVPTTRVQTQTLTHTETQTQTQTNVVTNQQTVVNQDTTTVVSTRSRTVPVTVTETQTETRTETQTVTQTETQPPNTVTETVTSPQITITVTVPAPPPPPP